MTVQDPLPLTRILELVRAGDETARRELWRRTYDEIHAIAAAFMRRERSGHTLQTTVVVHEVYFKLFGTRRVDFIGAGEFLAAAANAMRQVLVEYARKRNALKRGGGMKPVNLIEALARPATELDHVAGLALDEALTALTVEHPRWARVVEMRFFLELSVHETAGALGISDRQVEKDWSGARAWLFRVLGGDPEPPP
ncbi:MAG: hypothetical protein FLDDKLPJ_00922 [Phycisphaerae bacterium]|nr:hypothetical protein [Phycisphaerae bacterium]